MKRTLNQSTLMAVVSCLSLALLPNNTFAENNNKAEINRIQEKRSNVQEKSQKAKDEIVKLKKQQQTLLNSLDTLYSSIENAQKKIKEKEEELSKAKKEIESLKVEIKELQLRLDQRQEIINNRMRSLQKSGGNSSYLDILFGATSINDLIQRINAIDTFMKADKEIFGDQQNDFEKVEENETKLIKNQNKLEKDKDSLQKLSSTLTKQESDMKTLLDKLKEQEHEKEQDVLSLEEQEELLAEQEKAVKAASNGSNTGQLPTVSSGDFTRPADGYLSSGFGYRTFDNEMHWGVDIVKKGNVPIVSAADGVVIRAYQSSSYGNVVYITHNINGKIFTSVYAHMNKYQVSSGQSVSKGQQIGMMGNTGHSFGQHLHFELHAGQWNQSKSNAVNPAKYINF